MLTVSASDAVKVPGHEHIVVSRGTARLTLPIMLDAPFALYLMFHSFDDCHNF